MYIGNKLIWKHCFFESHPNIRQLFPIMAVFWTTSGYKLRISNYDIYDEAR